MFGWALLQGCGERRKDEANAGSGQQAADRQVECRCASDKKCRRNGKAQKHDRQQPAKRYGALTDSRSQCGDRRDRAGVAQVLRRRARLERGNPGRVAPVGEGVSELKIDFGPGYRVYYGQRGEELVIILGGGDKSSQDRDIRAAKKLWDEWKEQNHDES